MLRMSSLPYYLFILFFRKSTSNHNLMHKNKLRLLSPNTLGAYHVTSEALNHLVWKEWLVSWKGRGK